MSGEMTGRRGVRKHKLDGLITLLLFGVFAACILSVLLTGADVYRRLTARDQAAYARRTCVQYVATKVRQAPSGAALSVEDFGGTDALVMGEDIDGEAYLTRIYCYDGWLRELFTYAGGEFYPEDGEKIIEARQMDLSLEDGLLTVSITDETGAETELVLALRGEGAAP